MDNYENIDGMMKAVDSGVIAPLRFSYLKMLFETGRRMERRQDLPDEAFWTAEDLRNTLLRLSGQTQCSVVFVLSYRWLTQLHPDPDGFHLRLVVTFMKEHMDLYHLDETALFWDFGSLFQKPRSPDEEVMFEEGLKNSNVWYGHTKNTVLIQSHLPPGFNGPAYDQSGWCFVESAMSSVIKSTWNRYDLGKLMLDNGTLSVDLFRARTERRPPQTPEKVGHILKNDKVFTNSSDANVVAGIYKRFFDELATAKTLSFTLLRWNAENMRDLGDCLPRFKLLSELDLSFNLLEDHGAEVLADAIQVNTSLKDLNLGCNKIGDKGAVALAEALKVNTSLKKLCLGGNRISNDGAVALADALKVNMVLTELDLWENDCDRGKRAVEVALQKPLLST